MGQLILTATLAFFYAWLAKLFRKWRGAFPNFESLELSRPQPIEEGTLLSQTGVPYSYQDFGAWGFTVVD
jgi:hypothetical protein